MSVDARVFISYVHEDKDVAEGLQRMLSDVPQLETEVFLSADETQVLAGHVWLDRIRAGLESCEVLLLLLSERSINRAWVNFEAGAVWLAGKAVIPICIGRMHIEFLPQPYAGIQAVRLPSDAHYLLTSIHSHLSLGTPLPPARWDSATRRPLQQWFRSHANRAGSRQVLGSSLRPAPDHRWSKTLREGRGLSQLALTSVGHRSRSIGAMGARASAAAWCQAPTDIAAN